VFLEELAPLAIAELGRTLGRSDDVSEEDGGERALRRRHPGASKKRTDRGWVNQELNQNTRGECRACKRGTKLVAWRHPKALRGTGRELVPE
jgi:hypothetical protein